MDTRLEYRPSFPRRVSAGCRGRRMRRNRQARAPCRVHRLRGLRRRRLRHVVRGDRGDPRALPGRRPRVRSLDELLADPRIEIVDVATHPAERPALMRRALEAGKHVLSQKPFALDIADARGLVEEAERRGLRLAVNQNGRWAPAWRIATLLVQQGAIGDVCAVTHLYEHDFGWTVGDWPDELEHFADLRLLRPLDRHLPLLARGEDARSSRERSTTGARAAGGDARHTGAPGSCTSTTTIRPRRSGGGDLDGAARRPVLDPRYGGDDSRQRAQGHGLRRARARWHRDALRARRRLDARRLRRDAGKSCAAPSPRIASRSTPGATTCCRWR